MSSIKSFEQLIAAARAASRGRPPMRVAVCAADKTSVLAMREAAGMGLALPVFIGEARKIRAAMKAAGMDGRGVTVEDAPKPEDAAERGVELVKAGRADILMKGMVGTSSFLHPIFRHGTGLLSGNIISHVGVLDMEGYGRLIIQTDGGINIAPDVAVKKGIIRNAVLVARLLGVRRPKVALLSASEKVHPKIRSSVEARELALWAKGAVPEADVEGPMALDLAVSAEAVRKKGLKGKVPGRADALVASNIEMGNAIYKALRYFGRARGAGIVVGAACPIVLTSRSDPPQEKVNSVALAVLYAAKSKSASFEKKAVGKRR